MVRHRHRQPRFDSRDDLLDGTGATLDLHGAAPPRRRRRSASFIAAQARNARGSVVHIITGKGRGSANGSVLRPAVAVELRSPACAPLIADWARDADDGGYKVKLR